MDLSGGPETIAELFRELHSLKGAARYMELKSFAQSLNDAEDLVAAVRDGRQQSGTDTARQLSRKLDELHDGVGSIKSINDRFKEFALHDAGRDASSRSVRSFFDNMERMTQSVAEELGKTVNVRTATEFDTLPVLPELRNPVIHLVRNALAHGIEEGLERRSKGKPEKGLVEITFSRDADNRCRVEVRDDGRGIDFEAVRTRALDLGLISNEKASSNELLRVLFSPAFSSSDHANEISGRGVGLDAVQGVVQSLGGSIWVGTKADIGTRFTLRVPVGAAGGDE